MTKNISVVDEFGNKYGETYLKRAKQLVKKGRAHFVDDTKICLVCPPEKLEENNMSEDRKVTQAYIIEKIDQIIGNSEHITKALEEIKNIPESKGPGDMTSSSKADAIAQIVRSREETNHKLIEMFRTMYKALELNDVHKRAAIKLLEHADDEESFQNVKEALELIK